MFAFLKPLGRSAVLAGAAAFPAFAVAGPEQVPDAGASPAAVPSAAQIVVRDAATGRLRMPTAEEAQALHEHARSLRRATSPTAPEAKTHWSGARGARVTDEFMNYTVVVRRADGSLVELCVNGSEATAKVVKAAPVARPATLPTE